MNTLRDCFYEQGTQPTIQKIDPTICMYRVNKMLTTLFDSLCAHVEITVLHESVYKLL